MHGTYTYNSYTIHMYQLCICIYVANYVKNWMVHARLDWIHFKIDSVLLCLHNSMYSNNIWDKYKSYDGDRIDIVRQSYT